MNRRRLAAWVAVTLLPWGVWGQERQCVVSILNRTAEVRPDGSWRINNLPAGLGLVRARFTCVEGGVTRSGQSDFFEIIPNIVNGFESSFDLNNFAPVARSIRVTAEKTILSVSRSTTQLTVTATLSDNSVKDVTAASAGTTYINSGPNVVSVSPAGEVTALSSGRALVSARHEQVLASILITVGLDVDTDGDGIPDDVELANGMDPENPVDALFDADRDGLTAGEEIAAGTDPHRADTDGDFVNDGDESSQGTDPRDATSVDYTGRLTALAVTPPFVTMRTNALLIVETSRQLSVVGTLDTGQAVDLTSSSSGTSYLSDDIVVVNFGDVDGRIFAGEAGAATVTVSNAGVDAAVPVTVARFSPTILSFLSIPGQANNVDVADGIAYVAAGAEGLQIVDVTDSESPSIIAAWDTPGNANDVKVSGDRAYVADGSSGLQVIDVSDPTTPSLAGSLDTPGTAYDIAIGGGRVYIADGEGGVQIVDPGVGGRAAPELLGASFTPGTAYGVDIDPTRNLLAVADGSAGLLLLDVTDPTTPLEMGSVDTAAGGDGGLDVIINGDAAYVANGTPFFGTKGGIVVVDLASRSPVPGTLLEITDETPPTQSNIWDVATDGQLALGADNFSVNAVHTFNVTTPGRAVPSQLIDFSRAPSFRDDNGTGIDVDAGLVFLTAVQGISHHGSSSDGGLHIGRYLGPDDHLGVAPTVQITSPAAGTDVMEGRSVTVTATATDDVAVAGVQFLVNGLQVGVDTTAPFEQEVTAPLDSVGQPLSVQVRAFDLGDNFSDFATRALNVVADPPPTVDITAPADGDDVLEGAAVSVQVTATDNTAVTRVDFATDTGLSGSDTTAPYTFELTVPVDVTELVISANATDDLGRRGDATPVTIDVLPDPPPTVSFTSPPDGANAIEGSQILLAAEAQDNVQVAAVRFTSGTGWDTLVTTPPFQVVFAVPAVAGTSISFAAVATDNLGRTGTATPVAVMVVPDPLTTVIGSVIDEGGNPVVAASVKANGDHTGVTGPDGTFSIPDVPTILGNIRVLASAAINETLLTSASASVAPVHAGVTDVGVIELRSGVLFSIGFGTHGTPGSAVENMHETGDELAAVFQATNGANIVNLPPDTLGLTPFSFSNIDAVAPGLDGALYFSVDGGSTGMPGSGVAATAAEVEQQSYIFRSPTDGTNTLFLRHSQLGIGDGQTSFHGLNSLTILPDGSLVFSVAPFTNAAPGSPMEGIQPEFRGLYLYRSTGDGTHELFQTPAQLGLQPLAPSQDIIFLGGPSVNALDRQPDGSLWFAVVEAAGLPGTGLADAGANDLNYSVFRAPGDGTNSLALSADTLGLVRPAPEHTPWATGVDGLFMAPPPADDALGAAPTVQIAVPAAGAVVIEGTAVTFKLTVADDVAVRSVSLSSAETDPVTHDFPGPEQTLTVHMPGLLGPLTFNATATDLAGMTGSDSVTITVAPRPRTDVIGTVRDAAGAPVEGASVRTRRGTELNQTETGVDGMFRLANVLADEGNVVVGVTAVPLPGRAVDVPMAGSSGWAVPVVDGDTDVGVIDLLPLGFDPDLGTRVLTVDDTSFQVIFQQPGFTFPFAGQDWPGVYANSNGNITFDAGSSTFNPAIPAGLTDGPRLSLMFTDLDPSVSIAPETGVWVKEAPDHVRVTWNHTPLFSEGGDNTVQVVMYGDGVFAFCYHGVTADGFGAGAGSDTLDISVGIGIASTSTYTTLDYSTDDPFVTDGGAVYELFDTDGSFDLDGGFVAFFPLGDDRYHVVFLTVGGGPLGR